MIDASVIERMGGGYTAVETREYIQQLKALVAIYIAIGAASSLEAGGHASTDNNIDRVIDLMIECAPEELWDAAHDAWETRPHGLV